jgi:hypothetical protein
LTPTAKTFFATLLLSTGVCVFLLCLAASILLRFPQRCSILLLRDTLSCRLIANFSAASLVGHQSLHCNTRFGLHSRTSHMSCHSIWAGHGKKCLLVATIPLPFLSLASISFVHFSVLVLFFWSFCSVLRTARCSGWTGSRCCFLPVLLDDGIKTSRSKLVYPSLVA